MVKEIDQRMKKKKKLRNSAKAVIIQNGKMLVIQKQDGKGGYCVLPGGGQKKSENLHETLTREVAEEIGAKVKIGRLLHVREYFSEKHGFPVADMEIHQVEFFFDCKLSERYRPQNGSSPDSRQRLVKWVRLEKLEEVNFYPSCLIPILKDLEEVKSPVYLGDCN